MAADTFEKVKPLLLKHEGGYVDHPRDPGGPTNMGITQKTLSGWRGRWVSKAAVANLKRSEALAIYKARYWDVVMADYLPAGVDYAMYDFAVNSGPARAAKYLQRIVGAKADGVVGPVTLRAVDASGLRPEEISDRLCEDRLAFMKRLRTWPTFGKGWARRVADVKKVARELAVESYSVAPAIEVLSKKDSLADAPQNGKAVASDTSLWKTPEGLATGVTAVSGLGGMVSDSTPVLQYAFAFVFVVAALGVGYYLLQKVREE